MHSHLYIVSASARYAALRVVLTRRFMSQGAAAAPLLYVADAGLEVLPFHCEEWAPGHPRSPSYAPEMS
jgi:hypothetical protein